MSKTVGHVIGGALVAGSIFFGLWPTVKMASLQRRLRAVEREALTDPLTGLYNRRGCERRLAEDLARRGRRPEIGVTLVVADLDGLKQVNDQHGHSAGDQYVRAFGKLLKSNLRASDWVGRWAGDEFVLALWDRMPGTSANGSESSAQAVLQRLSDPVSQVAVRLPDGTDLKLSASFGVARHDTLFLGGLGAFDGEGSVLPHDQPKAAGRSAGLWGLFERADAALIEAKQRGKGMIVYA